MGQCGEFGCSIGGGCTHPMDVRDPASCGCSACGAVCHGRFAGCPSVWSKVSNDLPFTADRDVEFIALPYADLTSADPDAELMALAQSGKVVNGAATKAERPVDDESVDDALARQKTVNEELLEAVRRLEATVAALTAAPAPSGPATSAEHPGPAAGYRRRRSVEVIQWVDSGRTMSVRYPGDRKVSAGVHRASRRRNGRR